MQEKKILESATYGTHIGLKCKKCGALFHTKNIGYIGARTIFFSSQSVESLKKCLQCDADGHTLGDLELIEKVEV